MIAIAEVERLVLRALATLRAQPDRELRFLRLKSPALAVLHEAHEAYGYSDVRMPRWQPTPHDVSTYLDVLAWMKTLSRPEHQLVWWRSFGLSFAQIGMRLRPARSDETVRRRYHQALRQMWISANLASQLRGKCG